MIEKHLRESLQLSNDAVCWLVQLYDVAQIFDDYADGDTVTREKLDKLIFTTLVSLPINPFYAKHSIALSSAIVTTILKWKASDIAERNNKADQISFVWRAAYYDIVLLVYTLKYGYELALKVSPIIMKMYGEKYEDYIQEMKLC